MGTGMYIEIYNKHGFVGAIPIQSGGARIDLSDKIGGLRYNPNEYNPEDFELVDAYVTYRDYEEENEE